MTDDIRNHINEITEEDHRLHFMRQQYYGNLAEREAWNDALISYEEYYQGNMEYLEEKWLQKISQELSYSGLYRFLDNSIW